MHKHKIAAAIDIGSDVVRMYISQWNGRSVELLDKLKRPTRIGEEVFSTGYISFDTVRSLSATLAGFCEKALEYEVTRIHATATTALREAANQAYVLDHLSINNKLDVHVLEDTEASTLLFDAMKNGDYLPAQKLLLVYGGMGTIDLASLKDERIEFAQSVQTGLLKISEMLREAEDYSRHIGQVAEEHLYNFLTRSNRMRDFAKVDGLIFGTGDLRPLYKLCGASNIENTVMLPAKTLIELYNTYRPLSIDQISARHRLSVRESGTLYAMLALLAALVKLIKIKQVFFMEISLPDALLNLSLQPGARRSYNESLREGAVSSAMDFAGRYQCDIKHALHVADISMNLFERLRKIHGLPGRRSLLLEAACILHESGQFTNTADMHEASFDLIKDAQIYGMRSHDTLLTANIVAPQNLLGVARANVGVGALSEEDILFAAKMHALLHLADSLDASHKQKAVLKDVELGENHLTLSLRTKDDFALEQWMFRQSASLFKEIFGVVPQLEIEKIYDTEGNS